MRHFLLDTHLLLWAAAGSPRLPDWTRQVLADSPADVSFSVVSLWEIVIKVRGGGGRLVAEPMLLRDYARAAGMVELPVRGEHVLELHQLKPLHKDPFDTLLLAQARSESLELLTVDRQLLAYGPPATPA
ncbi:type II toxin-antitoxin system VapC family toxin [Georgenia sp. TF02-10]|uniref:type II toxin-antitoxin system VapC family toxin n=1 Tax=Georgenia sp. TF02-10 TaxID=2917725 RepID=UPI001FA6DBA6|nr:type II toxin-antitoxin system VapC family toxin [Georgenia sp. TF02-10]UNX55364.1 type II toxin-antitoxin system VapC family toxin [Georgenia sp. TF02-10]